MTFRFSSLLPPTLLALSLASCVSGTGSEDCEGDSERCDSIHQFEDIDIVEREVIYLCHESVEDDRCENPDSELEEFQGRQAVPRGSAGGIGLFTTESIADTGAATESEVYEQIEVNVQDFRVLTPASIPLRIAPASMGRQGFLVETKTLEDTDFATIANGNFASMVRLNFVEGDGEAMVTGLATSRFTMPVIAPSTIMETRIRFVPTWNFRQFSPGAYEIGFGIYENK